MIRPTKILIDGIDRLGKSTLVESIQKDFGYHLVIHYDKPKVLPFYSLQLLESGYPNDNEARRLYQVETNKVMFSLMKTKNPIIFDRTHLGEQVYAPLYRKYNGDYIYEMEKDFVESRPYTYKDDVVLILLTTSNFEMLVDDGLSFDPSKKEEEQARFIQAFERSLLPKRMVDIHNGKGGYRTANEIAVEALFGATF